MNLEQYVMGGFVIIGLVNGIQFLVDKDFKSFIKFMTAVLAGGVFGFLQWFAIPSLEIGLALGVSSSGIYKVASKIGGTK